MQFLKNGPAKYLDFNCSDLHRMSIFGGYKSLSCTFFSILPSARRTVCGIHFVLTSYFNVFNDISSFSLQESHRKREGSQFKNARHWSIKVLCLVNLLITDHITTHTQLCHQNTHCFVALAMHTYFHQKQLQQCFNNANIFSTINVAIVNMN